MVGTWSQRKVLLIGYANDLQKAKGKEQYHCQFFPRTRVEGPGHLDRDYQEEEVGKRIEGSAGIK